ncbi:MAG: hypothetical protein R2876_02085 [Eubacteriales bacterium]
MKKNMNLYENNIDDNVIKKALSGLKELDPPEGLLREAISNARRRKGRPEFKEKASVFTPKTWKYISAAAVLVLCLGIGSAFVFSQGLFKGSTNDLTANMTRESSSEDESFSLPNSDNDKNTDNTKDTYGGQLAATTSPTDGEDILSDTSTDELNCYALFENRSDFIEALSQISTCGVKTDELSDDIIIYANEASDIIDILNSYIYNLMDEEGNSYEIDSLSGIITIKVEFK